MRCTSETGDEIEFVKVGDEIGAYLTYCRSGGRPTLTGALYISPEDARALFNWLGVWLHRFGPGRPDDNQGP